VLSELGRILGRRGTAGRLGGDALALWAALPAGDADGLAAAVREDVRTRFSTDGVTVDVALGSAPARPGDDIAQALHAAGDALRRSRMLAARSPRAA
jgi:GGDEF domain-containing protein